MTDKTKCETRGHHEWVPVRTDEHEHASWCPDCQSWLKETRCDSE